MCDLNMVVVPIGCIRITPISINLYDSGIWKVILNNWMCLCIPDDRRASDSNGPYGEKAEDCKAKIEPIACYSGSSECVTT
jgi:hypothetical protein